MSAQQNPPMPCVQTLLEALQWRARVTPQAILLKQAERTYSYQQVAQQVAQVGQQLRQQGVPRGERIGLLMHKTPAQVVGLLGCHDAGALFVLINPILHPHQIQHILQDCTMTHLMVDRRNYGLLERLDLPNSLQIYLVDEGLEGVDLPQSGCKPLLCDLTAPLPAAETRETVPITPWGDDLSHIIYTSGSTGLPKGIVATQRNLLEGGRIVSSYLKLQQWDRILALPPLNFDYGLNQLSCAIWSGATLVLHDFFLPNTLLKILQQERITILPALVPVWHKMLDEKLSSWIDSQEPLSDLRVITNTGSKMPLEMVERLRRRLPHVELYLMYGLTEAFRSTYLPPEELQRRPHSMGRAIPGVEIMVVDSAGKPTPIGEVGELVHRGALITRGYWNQPELSRQVFRPHPGLTAANRHLEQVVYSGDLVKQDADGYLYYIGRRDEMIKTKGYRVSPTEVETLAGQLDGVGEAVATAYEADGEIKLRLIVTLTDATVTAEQIKKQFKKAAPFYLIPDEICFLAQFPTTATGKTDRKAVIASSHP
uniref:Putative AMP-dependent synthetase and ligase n=1 Tax=Magnetococcus massalia (strain MO-1) TaxID=451514 RepID=A0A1S7LMN0_MAGMO|nr:putative AMP-dependent synthetase and ligase [Candidatus Magnetococcus massalia]